MKLRFVIAILLLGCFSISKGQEYKFGKLPKKVVLQTEHQIEKDAAAAVVYRKTNTKFNYISDKGFQLQTEVHEIVKIYNNKGYDKATVEIPLYKAGKNNKELVTSLKGFTYNNIDGEIEKVKLEKGAIFDEETSKYWNLKKFTMPNIQDGSVIEYTYKFISPFTTTINEFRFQEEIPVDLVDMQFYAPEWMSFRTHGKGWIPLNIRQDSKERTLRYKYNVERSGSALIGQGSRREEEIRLMEKGYKVRLTNVSSIKKEAYTGNIDNYSAGLQFELAYTQFPGGTIKNYATTWEDVAKRIYSAPSFGKELEKTNYFKNTIGSIHQEFESPEKKLAAIYQYVKESFTWNGIRGVYTDEGVAKTFKDKTGNVADINLMLTAMLRHAGIEANPVLISTKSNGIPIFPTRSGFNYVVSGAIINGNLFLLDGTDRTGNINVLKPSLLNWQGRMIKKDGSSALVNLIPKKPAQHNAIVSFSFDEDLMLQGQSQNRYTGHFAKSIRNTFIGLSDEEQIREMEENLNGSEVAELEIKELKNPYKPISTSYNIVDMEAAEAVADKIYFSPSLYLAEDENVFKSDERKYPVDFSFPRQNRYIIKIKIPEGYAVESLPEPLAVSFGENLGNYRYQITENTGELQLNIQKTIGVSMVPPTSYGDLKNFFNLISQKEQEKVVLKKI